LTGKRTGKKHQPFFSGGVIMHALKGHVTTLSIICIAVFLSCDFLSTLENTGNPNNTTGDDTLVETGNYQIISSLKDSTIETDYLVIAEESLMDAAGQFAEYRLTQKGTERASVISWNSVVEFLGPSAGADAKPFFEHIYSFWRHAPRYILILGTKPDFDTTVNINPDFYYGDINDDTTCDMAIGRIPAQSNSEALAILAKIKRAEKSLLKETLIIVDDSCCDGLRDPIEFNYLPTKLLNGSIGSSYAKSVLYSNNGTGACSGWNDMIRDSIKELVIDSINATQGIVVFNGRTGSYSFLDDSIFCVDDIHRLTSNNIYMGILINTGIINNANSCLTTRLMMHPDGGAAAIIASTAPIYTHTTEQLVFDIFEYLDSAETPRLGEAFMHVHSLKGYLLERYSIIGDPATLVAGGL
jgi:hypothetical protein